jgi:hypothetical protein
MVETQSAILASIGSLRGKEKTIFLHVLAPLRKKAPRKYLRRKLLS